MNSAPREGDSPQNVGEKPPSIDVDVEIVLRVGLRCDVQAVRTGEAGGYIELEESTDGRGNRYIAFQYGRQKLDVKLGHVLLGLPTPGYANKLYDR